LIDTYQNILRAFDEARVPNSAVLIPWNLEDSDTAGTREELLKQIKRTFQVSFYDKNPKYFRREITKMDDFITAIDEMLVSIRADITDRLLSEMPSSGSSTPTITPNPGA
jgi:hypothetical protein